MILDPRAIALQGVGYAPLLVAVQGFAEAAVAVSYADANARSYGKKRTAGYGRDYSDADEMRRQIALMRQIESEDEIVLALVTAAAPLLGETKWRQ
jgi:hypothetical protein